ncbi:hypothetical protein BDQ12DRAFT_664240 [Crucibulum laeve]|uniref:Transmembrane protein n=1 Tax=Crucibulum laeve TaxID=68775 RepID=A0A5C3M716_9AGAR|nr:hypothetical protein BDQ12DRAFT_664240 [Crucibulum laeve]
MNFSLPFIYFTILVASSGALGALIPASHSFARAFELEVNERDIQHTVMDVLVKRFSAETDDSSSGPLSASTRTKIIVILVLFVLLLIALYVMRKCRLSGQPPRTPMRPLPGPAPPPLLYHNYPHAPVLQALPRGGLVVQHVTPPHHRRTSTASTLVSTGEQVHGVLPKTPDSAYTRISKVNMPMAVEQRPS